MKFLILILHATHGMFKTNEESINEEITPSPVMISKNRLKTLNRLDEREINYISFKSKLEKLPVNRFNREEMNYISSKSKLEKSPEIVFKSFPNESLAEREHIDSEGSVESETFSDQNLNPETFYFDDKTQYFFVYYDKDLEQTSKCMACCKNKMKEAILSEILIVNVKWVRFLENIAVVLSASVIKTAEGFLGDYSFDGFFIENGQIIHKRLLRGQADEDYYQNLLSRVEITKNKFSKFKTENELKQYFEQGANFGTTCKIGEYKLHNVYT